MKKIKNNKVLDLRNKSEHEKVIALGVISRKINSIFQNLMQNKKIKN